MSNQPPTDDELQQIRARAEAALPDNTWGGDGWEYDKLLDDESLSWRGCYEIFVNGVGTYPIAQVLRKEDAEFIANSKRDVLTLLAEVERLRTEADKWYTHAQQTLTAFQFSREQSTTLGNEVIQAQEKCRAKENENQELRAEVERLRKMVADLQDEKLDLEDEIVFSEMDRIYEDD